MAFGSKKATTLLFIGDLVVFIVALWVMLAIRYLRIPDPELFWDHLQPFSVLFVIWIGIFYMSGLYSKRAIFFKSTLWNVLLRTQLLNIILAALFFFFVPNIGIAPKTNLLLYLVVSLVLIFSWRIFLFPRLTKPSTRERAALIGEGPEMLELMHEVNENPRYRLTFEILRSPKDLEQNFDDFAQELRDAKVSTLIVDIENDKLRGLLPRIYELAFVGRGYEVLNFYDVYEEIFDRVPLSLLQYDWFLNNLSGTSSIFYDVTKRCIDIVGSLFLGIVTAILVPFIFVAMRLEGKGPLFIMQMRMGKDGHRILTHKFRSMRLNKSASRDWTVEEKSENPVTKVGAFLRRTSIDEFPQFINVLRGELSLIGPRNDIEGLGMRLAEAVPYYNIRYTVLPGITGWAQINQQYEQGNISPQSIEETKTRLAYDFYYIKHRSLGLDVMIALKTVKRMLFRVSSW